MAAPTVRDWPSPPANEGVTHTLGRCRSWTRFELGGGEGVGPAGHFDVATETVVGPPGPSNVLSQSLGAVGTGSSFLQVDLESVGTSGSCWPEGPNAEGPTEAPAPVIDFVMMTTPPPLVGTWATVATAASMLEDEEGSDPP